MSALTGLRVPHRASFFCPALPSSGNIEASRAVLFSQPAVTCRYETAAPFSRNARWPLATPAYQGRMPTRAAVLHRSPRRRETTCNCLCQAVSDSRRSWNIGRSPSSATRRRLGSHIRIQGRARKYGRCAGFHRIEVVVESVWFRRLVETFQVVGPPIADRLIQQFRFNCERSCRAS